MLRYVTISAAVICAASTPFVLFPRQTSAWVTPEQLIAVFLFWPVILTSLFLSLYSMLHLSQWKYSSSYIAVFVLALIFPSTLGATTVIRTIGQKTYLAEQSRRNKWFTYGKRLNPLIIDYVRRHPDRVSFPFNDDRATIAGLGEYLSARTLFTMSNSGIELRELPQLIRLEERFDFLLVVVGPFACGPAPGFFDDFALTDLFDAMTAES